MLAWLLQVDHCSDAQTLELSDDVVLLDQLLAQPLRCDDIVVDPVRVEPFDGWPLDPRPVFMRAGRAAAELADELGLLLELRQYFQRIAHFRASDRH